MSANEQAISVSADSSVFLSKLKTLELEPIASQLMHSNSGLGWTRSQAAQAIARYLMFLHSVYLYPNRQILPTGEVDRVWHYHRLNSSKYTEDCQMLFGRLLHHSPDWRLRGEAERQNLHVALAQTVAIFQEYVGAEVLPDGYVQPPADCESTQNHSRTNVEVTHVFPSVLNLWIEVWQLAQQAVAQREQEHRQKS